MDAEQLGYLATAPGQRLLDAAAALLAEAAGDLAATESLRRGGPGMGAELPEHVAAAMTQARLRARAVTKFGPPAHSMYFTADGLEQATHHAVAALRAERVATAGRTAVLDLCCGIGGDLLAFAGRGADVVGVDRDPVTAAVARANLAALQRGGVVEVADATTYPRTDRRHDTVFVDPARRGPAGRVFDPAGYSPPWSDVDRLVREGAIAKVAPGIPHALVPSDVEAEWVSVDGQLREATLWPAGLASCARRASVVRTRPGGTTTVSHLTSPYPDAADEERPWRPVGNYLYEPDDAVVRAHLVAEFAATVDGWLLDPHLAYVSTDAAVTTSIASGYRVVETLPFREKALRAALRARDVGPLQIKKRGVDVTPEQLRSRLRLTGGVPATIVLTRTPTGAQALLVEPLDRTPR